MILEPADQGVGGLRFQHDRVEAGNRFLGQDTDVRLARGLGRRIAAAAAHPAGRGTLFLSGSVSFCK